jgi:hypothetical protein
MPVDYSGMEQEEGHFEMDEDITTTCTYEYQGSSNVDNVKPHDSGKSREDNLAFSISGLCHDDEINHENLV